MTTPSDKPPNEPRQPTVAPPDLSNPDRFGPVGQPRPKPVLKLDYAPPQKVLPPGRWDLLLSIAAGMVTVVAAVMVFAMCANTARGTLTVPFIFGGIVLGACLMLTVRFFGLSRAIGGLAIGFLLLMLLGCAGLAIICGNMR